jgi:3-(3-hydroxy-phenyl)propionate hydroxylase
MDASLFEFRTPPELARGERSRYPVAIVGAGPVGLCAAIDLGLRGIRTLLIDEDHKLSEGSRAICFAKRTLEVLDRLGCGQRAVDKGVVWNVGKVFFHDRQLYRFDLLPESGHKRPAFINLQQYCLEQYLVERMLETGHVEARWHNRAVAVSQDMRGVQLTVETPGGRYHVDCDYLLACDGARSPVRSMLGLEARGQIFRDRFLIADVKMEAPFPTERWFWFDPPFHPGQSVLLHKQADNVWRIDFQLGWDADPEAEKKPERVIPRIQAMLGPERPFTLEWVSVYTFRCQRMERFRHGRVLFVGDSAHQVSPFGARGANSGIQDADNLVWKLALVLEGLAPEALLDSYDVERIAAADENILNSTRSTDFITPKSKVSRAFRDATLQLAEKHEFARRLVNSGRLSTPTTYAHTPLNSPDVDAFGGRMQPGAPALDAPLAGACGPAWLVDLLGGRFVAVYYVGAQHPLPEALLEGLHGLRVAVDVVAIGARGESLPPAPSDISTLTDTQGLFAQRYDAKPGSVYLFRPDQHLAARFRHFDHNRLRDAVDRALCLARAGALAS